MADTLTGNAYNPIITAQQYPTIMGASGSVGTSDTTGTAEPIRIGVNPATGAIYTESTGGQAGTNVNIVTGTQQTLGTVGTVNGVGTLSNVGSVNTVTAVTTV